MLKPSFEAAAMPQPSLEASPNAEGFYLKRGDELQPHLSPEGGCSMVKQLDNMSNRCQSSIGAAQHVVFGLLCQARVSVHLLIFDGCLGVMDVRAGRSRLQSCFRTL